MPVPSNRDGVDLPHSMVHATRRIFLRYETYVGFTYYLLAKLHRMGSRSVRNGMAKKRRCFLLSWTSSGLRVSVEKHNVNFILAASSMAAVIKEQNMS